MEVPEVFFIGIKGGQIGPSPEPVPIPCVNHAKVGVNGGEAGVVGMENEGNARRPEMAPRGLYFGHEGLIHFPVNTAGVDTAIFKDPPPHGPCAAAATGIAILVSALPVVFREGDISIHFLNGVSYPILKVKNMVVKRRFYFLQHGKVIAEMRKFLKKKRMLTISIIMGKNEKDENVRQRFGKYFVLDHLVSGGMAKIYRARFLGEEADKVIAIKMIKTQFSNDENFKKMFLDELNVIFGFEHPNVINTFDYGMNKGQLFVAMEYCDGRSVYEYINKLKKKKCFIPIDIAVNIASQICRGLHYVHKYRDKLTGKKKDIIHRDISPHNIMLGYEGSVKVIDFGIAKVNEDSEHNGDATQSGTIKGKISYLAPEYIEGAELDHRYDQFATGITLWEMLCGRKLFTASNNMAILKKIQQCVTEPPSSINPKVPKELDEIVMKALSRDRNNRYDNMDMLDRALAKFLNTHYPDFHSSDIGYFSESLFKEEIERDRKKLFEFGKIDIKPYIEEVKREQKKKGGSGPDVTNPTSPSGSFKTKRSIAIFDLDSSDGKGKYVESDSLYDEKIFTGASLDNISRKIRKTIDDKNFKIKNEKKELKMRLSGFEKKGSAKQNVKLENIRKEKEDDEKISTHGNLYEWENNKGVRRRINSERYSKNKIAAAIAAFLVMAGVLGFFLVKQKKLEQANKAATLAREMASVKKQEGELTLDNFNRYKQKLFIDGEKMDVDLYSTIKIKSRDNIVIRVESRNKRTYVAKINVAPGESKRLSIPDQPKEQFGKLRSVGPKCAAQGASLHFVLYGEKRNLSLPFKGLFSFPLKGDGDTRISEQGFAIYELTYKSRNGKEKNIEVEFQSASNPVNVCELL